MEKYLRIVFILCVGISLSARSIDSNHKTYPLAKESPTQLKELLAIPNDANFPQDLAKNMTWVDSVLYDISPFIKLLSGSAIIIPLINSYNNQHRPNENLRIGNYFDGVRTFYAFLNSKI